MRSTIIEVDEDVFQVTTEYDDGRITVETYFGRDAYEQHMQKAITSNGTEHTSSRAGRIAAEGNYSVRVH